jgi:hypothetical protein
VKTGKLMTAQANANTRRGPGRKNLGPSAMRKPNPAAGVRSVAGKNLKGPDKGAGGM